MKSDGSDFQVLHVFQASAASRFAHDLTDGVFPLMGLVGSDSVLYGTTFQGGAYDQGLLYAISTAGGFTPLFSFSCLAENGCAAGPTSGVLLAGGSLYGVTGAAAGAFAGTVWRFSGSVFDVLHVFGVDSVGMPVVGDGALPTGELMQASDGFLYGVTNGGGTASSGTVFRIRPDGTGYQVVTSFAGPPNDGALPQAALVQGSDSYLYGPTTRGGTTDCGAIAKVSTAGVRTLAASFDAGFGCFPATRLVQGSDGNLYGTTSGTIFRLPIATTVSGAPLITSANSTTFTVGSFWSFTVTTSGTPTPALTLTGSLPRNVTFHDNGDGTATLSGAAASGTGGSYAMAFRAANGISPEANQPFILKINGSFVADKGVTLGAHVTIGAATQLKQDVRIDDNAVIGASVLLNQKVVIGASVRIGDFTTIDKGATIGPNAQIGKNVRIGQLARVGANTVVPDGTVVPARTSWP